MEAPKTAFGPPGWVPGGCPPATLVEWELRTAAGDGRDPVAVAELKAAAPTADDDRLLEIYHQLLELPVLPGFAFQEPDDLAGIRSLRPDATQRRFNSVTTDAELFDRLHGGWLGRCVGCTLGGPGETFRPRTRERLKEYLGAFTPSEWPIRDYLPLGSPSKRTFRGIKTDATRGNVRYAPQDDDLTHTMIGQIVLGKIAPHPLEFETQDLARAWLRHLPVRLTEGGTALLACRNLLIRYPMRYVAGNARGEDRIDWHWVATHSNPFREDLDAGLRADAYGYACPGMTELAAELAWRDARLSNVKNGIYCSMLYAAMVAAAFALDDPVAIVRAGLAEIPSTSRLYAGIQKALQICRAHRERGGELDAVHDALGAAFGDDDGSTSGNVAAVVAGLVMGGHDFEKVITCTVMGGLDCDTTGATAGSIAGTMLGASALPKKWTDPLNNTVHGGIVGYQPIAISECARRSLEIAKRVLERQ
jgi:hypothetical protein